MPDDKWGNPHIYPTKQTAGVSGSGSGFYWQQANNIFDDSDDGMVHIGKEYDQVQVISESTGEWEFPYDSGADYYSFDINTGHHSGGESHGCEGAHYMVNVTINDTPPQFYFAKQMWHGGSKVVDSQTGTFTHPLVTEKVVGGGWKGLCGVRYNKKDGRSPGHDSVILEIWWNEDPDADIKKWFMVKRTEDKGGWSSGGETCDGVSDQVITWSNIQHRYKSGTPEFSLHPIKPEFEDGGYIHSIGGANMSFEDSENRGYGYSKEMPRDVEMKCHFKFASNNGICRLKNVSLREIDPSLAFDDDPEVPPPDEGPVNTQTISGKLKLLWDLNTSRVSACAGTGGGGGSGGLAIFYTVAVNSDKELSDSATFDNRKRITMSPANSSSIYYNKLPKQVDIPLKKVGTPGASPVISFKIWNTAGTVVYTSPTTFDPTTLSTSYVSKTFSLSTNTHTLVVGDRIGVEYTGTSSANYIVAGYIGTNTANTTYEQYEGSAWQVKSRSLAMDVWE